MSSYPNEGAEALSKYLRAKKLGQNQFGRSLGLTASAMSKLLSGARLPSLALAYRLEQMTGGAVRMQGWCVGAEDGRASQDHDVRGDDPEAGAAAAA